jgi:hypothetical protein
VADCCWSLSKYFDNDQEPLLGNAAPKEPFGQPASTKRSVGAKKQNVGKGG